VACRVPTPNVSPPDHFTHHGNMDELHLDVLFLENGCKNKEEFFEKLRKDY
jgi:hypothetical protein